MYSVQERLLYDPSSELIVPHEVGLLNAQVIKLATSDGEKLIAWYAPAAKGKRTVLFLHGKGGNIGGRPKRFGFYTSKGYGVLFLSYRGYGGSTGHPSERGLLIDAETAYDWLIEAGIGADQILLVGESMGTGIAVMLAARHPVAALALEAPYSSIADVAEERYWSLPTRYLINENYEAFAEIKRVRAPVLMQHGEQDESIPIRFGEKLFGAANEPKEFIRIPGRNHFIFGEQTWATEIEFFERVLGK
jgi:uncharacterized protein